MDAYVQLTGNVGGAVEFRTGRLNAVPIASFRLAHTPRIRRNGEWVDGPTTWISVTCFRALAENVAASLHRGQPVLVAGRLRTNVWEKDGVTYERLMLEAMTVGHDLSRGTASFTKTATESPTDERADSLGEMLHHIENQHRDSGMEDEDPESPGAGCADGSSTDETGGGDSATGNRVGADPWARIEEDGVVAGVG
ncbi:single-stranded DNA-binding protein [Microlunatus phosphovorus NM-1]|uniref:Single-stranded DNA-binding protein n=1 Tax=Microlunatus phosphovorus (strain ATCC 700054 / DSM 10555 / JCM 9379 / NBRC 101784 / NCIMB 13414 / VKM Ac-1990 / NM-1) TaxID=1032480 RepID=F5XP88_MICPN|nr:single-stranded DNA-binding protein [Microlunatus phosphovorus]BAK36728.1 single-stranded DNA-binding protein [Microlunatus phosphovorus NM-1]